MKNIIGGQFMEEFIDGIEKTGKDAFKDSKDLAQKSISKAKKSVNGLMNNSSEGVLAGEPGEGAITKRIESITSKIPSATFLSLAVGSVGISLILRIFGRKEDAQFVGQWVPTILTLGLYNKLVKLEGSE